MLQGDSVLVLEKPEAVVISNSLSQKHEFMDRLRNSLKREAQMLAIWENTQAELEQQRDLTGNVREQLLNAENRLVLTEDQLEKTESLIETSKRKSLLTGLGIGGAVGFVVAAIIFN